MSILINVLTNDSGIPAEKKTAWTSLKKLVHASLLLLIPKFEYR